MSAQGSPWLRNVFKGQGAFFFFSWGGDCDFAPPPPRGGNGGPLYTSYAAAALPCVVSGASRSYKKKK